MSANHLQPVADRIVLRAKDNGSVVAREVREELARSGLDEGLWKEVLALARPALSYRRGRYHYSAPVSERVRAEQSSLRDVHQAVQELLQQAEAAEQRRDRRGQGRRAFVQPVQVITEDNRQFTLLTRDLSAAGIRLIGTRSLLGQKVRIRIDTAGTTHELTVRILWACSVGDELVENGGTFIAMQ